MSDVKIVVSAQDSASKVLQQVRSSLGDVQTAGSKLTGVLGAVGAVFSANAATAWVRNIVDGVDALNDIKDASGASIENISALEDVAARTGISFNAVGDALTKFNKVLSDAKPGSEAEQTLKNLGLSAKELKAIDPAEALLKFSIALNDFADDGNKARVVQDLLGKSYKDLAPLLKNLAEAGQLNATVTTEQAEQAEIFNKQLFALEKNAKDAGRALTSDLVIGINKAAQAMRESGLVEGLRTLLTGDDQYKNDKKLTEQTDELLTLEKDIAQLRASGAAIDAASARKKEERLKVLQQEIKTTMSYRQVLAEAGAKPVEAAKRSLPESSKATTGKTRTEEITDEQRALASYVQGLQNQLDTTQKLTEEQKALNFLKTIGVAGEIDQVRELVLGQAQMVDGIKAQEEATKQLNEARRQTFAYLDNLASELQAMDESNQKLREQVEEIGLTTEAVNALKLARLDATIAQEEQTRAEADAHDASVEDIALMERRIALLKEQRALTAKGQVAQAAADTRDKQDKASKEFADTLHNDLKGAFSAAFRDTKDPLGAFGEALADVMYSRASTALAEAIADAAIQKAGASAASSAGGSSGFGEFFASLFSSFDGGGSTGGGPRSGGLDGKGGFMALLHPQETVVDHTRGQSAGGSVVVSVNVDASGTSAEGNGEQAKQIGALIGNAVRGVLIQEKRPGGMLA
jgi:hypothetical protein